MINFLGFKCINDNVMYILEIKWKYELNEIN